MAPYPKITTFPPLAQLTLIVPEQEIILFTVIIEWNTYRPAYPFELALAYGNPGTVKHESQWDTIPLAKKANGSPYILDAEHCQRAVYTGKLSRQDLVGQTSDPRASGHCFFTVKFRVDAQAPWQWVSVLDGTKPGELVLQRALDISTKDALLLENLQLAEDWNVRPLNDDKDMTPTQQYLLESKFRVKAAAPGDPFLPLPLAALPNAVRYFSVVRLEPYWLGPRQGKGPFFHTSEDSIATSFLLSNGLVVTLVVLGWVDDVYQVFRSDEQGRIVVALQNDSNEDRSYRVVVSVGLDFHSTMASAMDQIRIVVAQSDKIARLNEITKDVVSSSDKNSTDTSTEQWADSLSFCTWNALGQDLTQSKILSALEQLEKSNIHISTLLIDDNWQTLGPTKYDYDDPFQRGWADMEANTLAAPNGLKDLITGIRDKYPKIKDIGVWHALMGYWGGISPSGSIAKQYPTQEIEGLLMGNKHATITTIAPEALHRFYDDFYRFLKSCGLTFVKTDVQHMLSVYQTPQTRRDLISTYQSAWTAAHLTHFHGKAISCMSQVPQTLFHSLLQTATPAVVHRNSDDFYPEVPASHPWHVWTNAHNAVFGRHLNVVLDWDMFQTDHEFSAYHAAARCVSGGPILITDVPGRHDVDLIAQMTARSPGGTSVALRTQPGVAVDVFGLYNEVGLLKVAAKVGSGGAVMAVFNVAEKDVRGMIHVDEFGLRGVDEVIVRGHRTGELFGPITTNRSTDSTDDANVHDQDETTRLVHTRLAVRGWDILTAQPVQHVETSAGKRIKFCVLGLLGKMSGAAAITAVTASVVEDERLRLRVSLKALGRLGVWFGGVNAAKVRVEVEVQGSKVDEELLRIVSLPGSRDPHGSSGDGGGSDGHIGQGEASGNADAGAGAPVSSVWRATARVCEVDVEAFWKQREMWDEGCQEAVVELLIG